MIQVLLGIFMMLGGWHIVQANLRNLRKLTRFKLELDYGAVSPSIQGETLDEIRYGIRNHLGLEDVLSIASLKKTFPVLDRS